MTVIIGRRELLAALGGAAAAWPLAARGQQPGKLPTIGFIGVSTPSAFGQWVAPFVQRLRELGWIEGAHDRDRISLGGRTQRALPRDRRRVGPVQGGRHCYNRRCRARSQASDDSHPDRLCGSG